VNTNPSIDSLSREILELKNLVVGLATYIEEQDNDKILAGWICEKKAMNLTGLSTSSLYRLRKSGKVRSSFIVGKMFYMAQDFKQLLDTNHRLK
jgi:hypothetical protein